MYPFSQINWPRILFTRRAVVLLGIAAALSVGAMIIRYTDLELGEASPVKYELLSIMGATSSAGFFSLLVCMGAFWLKCDRSSKTRRTIWFVLLLIGFAFGSQVAYYALVYVPAASRRIRNPECEDDAVSSIPRENARNRIGPFRRVLLMGWGFLLLPLFGILALPKSLSLYSDIIAVVFFLWTCVVALESFGYGIYSLYRSGMSRPPSSARRDLDQGQDRDK